MKEGAEADILCGQPNRGASMAVTAVSMDEEQPCQQTHVTHPQLVCGECKKF